MSDATAEKLGRIMSQLADCNATIARLTAEVTTLRARCERLRVLWDLTEDEVIRRSANNDTWTAAEFAEHDRQYARARAECDAHNDLSPKEPTDGQ